MNNRNDQSVYSYLNSIDTGPLLTREQEEKLIKSIEVYQKQILTELIVTKYSKKELLTYLQSLESRGLPIVDISKKLDEESPKDLVDGIEVAFKSLLKVLEADDVDPVQTLLDHVGLTGTIIHGVVLEIRKKHSKITDVENKFKQVRKYFTTETDDQVVDLITQVNEDLVNRLRKEYALTEVKAYNKISEWKNILIEVSATKVNVGEFSFKEVKDTAAKVSTLEFQAKRFKEELITRNLRLVVSRAKRFLNKGLDFDDLIQEGNLGLMKAVDKFDSSKKTKVSTYATWWIDQSIRRAISNKGKTVRVPTHIEWEQTKLNETIKKLTGKLLRPPTLKEISEASGRTIEFLEDLLTRAQHEIGIEEELSSGMSLMDLLQSDASQNPQTITEQKIMREKIRDILATLPPRTEKIIRLRFGIGEVPDDEGTTLQAIADQIGITKQGVRVVECAAFKHLKKKAKGLISE